MLLYTCEHHLYNNYIRYKSNVINNYNDEKRAAEKGSKALLVSYPAEEHLKIRFRHFMTHVSCIPCIFMEGNVNNI